MADNLTTDDITTGLNLPALGRDTNNNDIAIYYDPTDGLLKRAPNNDTYQIQEWEAKTYEKNPQFVTVNDKMYKLKGSLTLPYTSTDFAAELAAGDWIDSSGSFDSIKFNPNYEPTSTQEGEVYFNGKWHTIEYDTGLGAIIRVGQTVYDVFYNDTGAAIQPFKALHLNSAILFDGELYPTFELADASDYEKIQGTITISCCTVANGALGVCVRDATKITGGDTSSIPGDPQLWVSDDGSGDLTGIKPVFPSASISVGGRYNSEAAPNGQIFVNITSTFGDIFHEAWDGSVIESFDFRTESDGVNVVGTLENVNPLLDLTLNFSDGTFRLDTTTTPLTIALTPGTDALEVTNYVYIPISTKVLTVSTSGWPTTEHCRIAELEIQSAATTQTDGGTLGNQNTNDHIKKEDDNGHILHATEWIREQYATMRPKYGSEVTFDNTGGNGYVIMSAGYMFQAHRQNLEVFNMATGDQIRVWNDESGNRPKISNLASITTFADGSAWNNSWAKIVVWRVGNKGGEYAPVMLNKPTGGYNSSDAALADLDKKAVYTIPDNFKTKAVLIGEFAIRISGGVITYSSGYNDLRGVLPISVAGGSSGGGAGVTTYLALTDTPSSRAGKVGQVIVSNAAESADEYEPKGWIYNAARSFYHNIVSLATANRTITFRDKDINVAGLDDLEATEITLDPSALEFTEKEQSFDYTQSGAKTIAVSVIGDKPNRIINGTWKADGSLITKPSDMKDYSGLFVGNNYTPSSGDVLDLYFCTLRLEGSIVVRLNAINLGGGIVPSSITITGYSGLGLNAYVDIDLSEGGYGANDGSTPIAASDFNIANFVPDGATALSISSVEKTTGGALTGGETSIRINLSVTGTPTGNESFEIQPFDATSIYTSAGTAMAATETTGVITLINEASAVAITNYAIAADNSYVDVYFNRGVWGDNAQATPVALADLQITNLQASGATAISISSITNNGGASLVGGETIVRCNLSLTGTSDNGELFEIQPIDGASIYDSSANALLATETTDKIPLFKQGSSLDLTFPGANLVNFNASGTVYTASIGTWQARGLSSDIMGGNGYIENEIIAASTDISLLGFNTSQINGVFSDYEEYVFQNGSNIFYGTLGTNTQAIFVPSNNSKMRLTRNGSTAIALYSQNNGESFRLVKVSARVDNSTYYIQIQARNTGETNTNPKYLV